MRPEPHIISFTSYYSDIPYYDCNHRNFPVMLRYNGIDHLVLTFTEALCRKNQIEKAEKTLYLFHENDVPMTSSAFCEVLRSYCIAGHADKAIIIYKWLITQNLRPLPMAYHHICTALRKQSDTDGLIDFMASNRNISC